MHAVIGGVAAAGGNRNTVRSKQAGLAAGDTTISYFENLDLQPQLYDNLHFDKEAKLTVGERYAHRFFEAGVATPDYGKFVFIGDSITQGGNGNPSYRYTVFKHLADRSATYTFTGSVTGAHQNNSGATPDHNGQTFLNQHDGHWGWRVSWENARLPLPSSRRSNNRGEGSVLNWTGQATTYELNTAGNFVPYPDPAASGSGNTGTTYIPDTVSIMIGVNDLADGSSPAQVRDDIGTMIDQLRAANPNVSIFLNHILPTNQSAAMQSSIIATNALLQPLADTKNAASTTSPVWVCDPATGFDPLAQTYDNVHPNAAGEKYVGDVIASCLGLIERPDPPATMAAVVSHHGTLRR